MGRITVITGPVLLSESHLSGWIVKATIDAKNRHGAYVNGATYTFLFRGEKNRAHRCARALICAPRARAGNHLKAVQRPRAIGRRACGLRR